MEFGLYIHIPFCPQKCFYCDFNSYVLDQRVVGDYLAALHSEIDAWGRRIQREHKSPLAVQTVFFGGGTPTTLLSDRIGEILEQLKRWFPLERDAEITVEANPGTMDAEKFFGLKALGVNRLSMGIQSFDDHYLTELGRVHTASEAVEAYHAARVAGFDNLSFDLIFALPRQTLEHWQETLNQALKLSPEHISLYSLTIEEGTRFFELHRRGRLPLPDEETDARMYEYCLDILPEHGYEQYEVSNFARPGYRCRHNQIYWRNEPYLGFGAGAAGYWQGTRYLNHRPLKRYIADALQGRFPIASQECLPLEATMGETMLLGLRMMDGVSRPTFRERFGIDPADRFAPAVRKLTDRGLLDVDDHCIRLTRRGLLLADTVQAEFI